ncbi:MAG: hypothetical protein PWR25_1593 [Euryarchaeota archaeon]|jgi:hypothetical protein|nr:hypothetical protein [Euryarchaeota archaeon]MDN5340263.1 hypothetical protein [Euryarchaeota archaeon]
MIGEKMPEWRYTGKSVSDEKARQALAAVKSACFGCDVHSSDCALAKAAGEIVRMTEKKE